MLKKIICAATLFVTPLIGETIGTVNYTIPESAKEWKVANEMKNPESTTIVYLPSDNSQNEKKQVFTVHSNTFASDTTDNKAIAEGLIKTLELYYPGKKVQGTIVEKEANSILFEWAVEEEGKEILHGWYRMFGSNNGTVLLGYQTGDIPGLEKERANWLPALKGATDTKK